MKALVKIPLYPQQASNIRAQRAALVQSFRGYETAVQTAANQLLFTYRDAKPQRDAIARCPPISMIDGQLAHSFLNGP